MEEKTEVARVDRDVIRAARTYLLRQARKEHPEGSRDNANRWYPHEVERQECCRGIRAPSASWPNSLLTHCRTMPHVAALHRVSVGELRRYLASPDAQRTLAAEFHLLEEHKELRRKELAKLKAEETAWHEAMWAEVRADVDGPLLELRDG